MKFEVRHNGKVVISKDLAEGSFKIGRAPDCNLIFGIIQSIQASCPFGYQRKSGGYFGYGFFKWNFC